MSRRKLSRQQADRVAKIQQSRIDKARRKAEKLESELDESGLGAPREGRIVANFGVKLIVEPAPHQHVNCLARQNLGSLVVGDFVIWQPISDSDNEGVIVAVLDRRSLLSRPLYHGEIKPIAANVDQILILVSPLPAIQSALIDRYLIATEIAEIKPVIVFNKADLFEGEILNQVNELEAIYGKIGYTCVRLSAKHNLGKTQLADLLKDKTSVLVGQSGVGKSSTIKMLLPDIDVQIGELQETTALGKHTTSVSRLYHLPNGGEIIDSPGVRDFGLWHMDNDKILWGFREFRPFIGACRFSDCTHRDEPDCAIRQAMESGDIAAQRYDNYHSIVQTNKARND